jgi:hypothetical protein
MAKRAYRSETDYPILVETARKAGLEITPLAKALEAHGIRWPGLQDNVGRCTPEQDEMDREVTRAWLETGVYKPDGSVNREFQPAP